MSGFSGYGDSLRTWPESGFKAQKPEGKEKECTGLRGNKFFLKVCVWGPSPSVALPLPLFFSPRPCTSQARSWAGEPGPLHLPGVRGLRAAPSPCSHPLDSHPGQVENPQLLPAVHMTLTPTWL